MLITQPSENDKPDGTITIGADTYDVYLKQQLRGGSKNSSKNESKNENKEVQEGGKKKSKKAKGTRKLSGYMKFCQAERAKLLQENPSLKSDIPGIGRALGAKWRALSDAEKKQY